MSGILTVHVASVPLFLGWCIELTMLPLTVSILRRTPMKLAPTDLQHLSCNNISKVGRLTGVAAQMHPPNRRTDRQVMLVSYSHHPRDRISHHGTFRLAPSLLARIFVVYFHLHLASTPFFRSLRTTFSTTFHFHHYYLARHYLLHSLSPPWDPWEQKRVRQ